MLYLILQHNRPFPTYKECSGVLWRFKTCIRATSYFACVAEIKPKPLKVWPGQSSAGMGVTQNENYRLLITRFKFLLRASNTQLSVLWAWVIRFRLNSNRWLLFHCLFYNMTAGFSPNARKILSYHRH